MSRPGSDKVITERSLKIVALNLHEEAANVETLQADIEALAATVEAYSSDSWYASIARVAMQYREANQGFLAKVAHELMVLAITKDLGTPAK